MVEYDSKCNQRRTLLETSAIIFPSLHLRGSPLETFSEKTAMKYSKKVMHHPILRVHINGTLLGGDFFYQPATRETLKNTVKDP